MAIGNAPHMPDVVGNLALLEETKGMRVGWADNVGPREVNMVCGSGPQDLKLSANLSEAISEFPETGVELDDINLGGVVTYVQSLDVERAKFFIPN